MLKKISSTRASASGARIAIVASRYNARYVDAMVRAAKAELQRAGAVVCRVVRVPGAFEIPVVVARIARHAQPRVDGIICLGVILRGATTHAQHIGEVVSNALGSIAVETEIPVVHEVLLLENEQQAKERCLEREHNRGAEAAQTALKMARAMKSLT